MSFTSKVINGGLRYRATKAVKSILQLGPKAQSVSTEDSDINGVTSGQSVNSRLRQHPFYLSLPPLALPSQLDKAAINYLRENSLSTPKAIEDRAQRLINYLWSRPLMSESETVKRQLKKTGTTLHVGCMNDSDPDLAEVIQYHNFDTLTKMRPKALQKIKEECLTDWKSLTYSGHNCELYLTARLAPNFASTCRVLYEIRKRCPQFIPRNLFDFGSGLGTVTWAVNSVWPVGCVREHYMVEPSADMTRISEFMLRKSFSVRSSETIFPGIYHRRFMPSNKETYDLVVSAHSLLELPGRLARQRILSSLWNRTSGFLILIEQGTRAGFASILEARDWLLDQNDEEVHLFAPCPHHRLCGKRDMVCNIPVRYYHFGLTRVRHSIDIPIALTDIANTFGDQFRLTF